MRRVMTKAAAFGLVVWLAVQSASAQVLVGTVRSADEVIDVAAYVATLVGREDIAKQIGPFIDTLTGNKGLAGIDRKAPFGLYVQSLAPPGQLPPGALFIPITGEEAFVELLRALNAEVEKPDQEGIRKVTLATGQTAYLRFAHGHAFLSGDREILKQRLLHPKKLVSEVHRQHLLCISLRVNQIPPAVRKSLLAMLRQAISKPVERKPDESEVEYRIRQYLDRWVREQLLQLVQDLDEVVLWADLDKSEHQLSLALDVTARAGTPTANTFRKFHQTPSRLRGLQQGADSWLAVAYPAEGPLRMVLDEVAAGLEKAIAQKPQQQQAILRKLYEGILPSLKGDTLEFAAALYGPAADGKLTPLVAIRLREGAKLEAALRELVQVLPEDAKSRIRLDAAKLAGHSIHELHITPDEPQFAKLFGEEKLLVLLANDYLLVSAGTHASSVLQQAVQKISQEHLGPGASLQVSVRQIALFAQDSPSDKRFREAVQRTFVGQDASRDRLRLVLEGKENTLRLRVEVPTLVIRVGALANQ